jgi:tripartite-type tricarboxylate transporter receptor subunit TctC
MRRILLSIIFIGLFAFGASAQPYPSRPITLIVPFPAGGITDIIARIVADRMRTSLGQPVIAENVGGAGGTIGLTRLFRSAPDGYTIAIGQWTSNVGGGAMYQLPFDLQTDLQPISMLSIGTQWIIGRKDLPATNLKELIAWLKDHPKTTGGTIGAGSGIHMCLVYFASKAGVELQFVPYRGGAPMMQDLVAGQIDISCPEAGQTLPQYRAGTIKAFAVMNEKRWFAVPEVPTVEEGGVPGVQFPFWHGLWAPKDTPQDIVAKLNAAVIETLADPTVRQRFTELGHEVAARQQQAPAALAAYYKAEIDKWWPIIKAANIKAE